MKKICTQDWVKLKNMHIFDEVVTPLKLTPGNFLRYYNSSKPWRFGRFYHRLSTTSTTLPSKLHNITPKLHNIQTGTQQNINEIDCSELSLRNARVFRICEWIRNRITIQMCSGKSCSSRQRVLLNLETLYLV